MRNPTDGWQLIETAPRDIEILGYDSKVNKFDVIMWASWLRHFVPTQTDGQFGPDKDEFGYNSKNITHWMFLPSPPIK